MKIRSITYFLDTNWPLDEAALEKAGRFIDAASQAFQKAGYEVQTTRLATQPFPLLLGGNIDELVALAEAIEKAARQAGITYVSLGPALPEFPESYPAILPALQATQNVFFSGAMTTFSCSISREAIRACADVIQQASTISPDGFANLRFAALANVPPGSPFFPASYHDKEAPAFALAIEAAALAVQAFSNSTNLEQVRAALITSLETHGAALSRVADELQAAHSTEFTGIDFSLAPYPVRSRSLGEAFEALGVPKVGQHGSLATAAMLAEAVNLANFPRTGFSGLMLPVLEDTVLAERAAEGVLTVKDLLLYSAVCGTGLDTVPLPGNTSVEALDALLLDLAVLAHRLDKPLTARLMPIPGKSAGDPTNFTFDYFANSRVMALEAYPLKGALVDNRTFAIHAR